MEKGGRDTKEGHVPEDPEWSLDDIYRIGVLPASGLTLMHAYARKRILRKTSCYKSSHVGDELSVKLGGLAPPVETG